MPSAARLHITPRHRPPAGKPAARYRRPSRARLEAAIAALIDLLDDMDAPAADLEPQPGDDTTFWGPDGRFLPMPPGVGDPLDAEMSGDENEPDDQDYCGAGEDKGTFGGGDTPGGPVYTLPGAEMVEARA